MDFFYKNNSLTLDNLSETDKMYFASLITNHTEDYIVGYDNYPRKTYLLSDLQKSYNTLFGEGIIDTNVIFASSCGKIHPYVFEDNKYYADICEECSGFMDSDFYKVELDSAEKIISKNIEKIALNVNIAFYSISDGYY